MLLVVVLVLLALPIGALWIRSWRRQFLAESIPPAYRFVRAHAARDAAARRAAAAHRLTASATGAARPTFSAAR